MDFKLSIANEILTAAERAFGETGLQPADIAAALEIPPSTDMGDYAFPCFKLSKALRKSPMMISDALAANIQADYLGRVESVKGYLNFFIDRATYAEKVVEAVLTQGESYGSDNSGAGKTVVLDYSSINIAKRFHIGHLSTTMIGHSLKRIYDFNGYTTVGINHLGDWGTQFGKMIYAYKAWGSREDVEKGGVNELVRLYVKFHEEAEKDPSLDDKGREWFRKIEEGDEEALSIWNWFKELTLKDTAKVYDLLGVTFDSYAGESFYNDKMQPVVDELREKGLLTRSQGAEVVMLDDYGMPPAIVLRSDGATLYITRDLAAAFYRHNEYHFDKCLYVVAYQQNLHFKQLFKIIDLMGHDWYKGMEHVSFGMVSYEGRALSTREGYVVYLEDLLNKAIEKAREIIEEKSPNLPNKDEVARQVGVGAVVYFDLHNERIKDIDFRWERALSFEGETGPYVQYTHARCCSVLRKAQAYADVEPDYSVLCDDEALDVLMLISRFPEVVRKAMDQNEPSLITRHTTSLAQAYNKYYFEHRIMEENDPAGSAARVNLTDAVRDVIKTGLYLIGVEAPERM